MLYSMGTINSTVNFSSFKSYKTKVEYPKTLSFLKSLDSDKFSFSSAKNIDSVNNISFCGKPQQITQHDNPYVLVHGTLAKEDSLVGLRDFLKSQVHSIDLTSYPMITEGNRIEVSAGEVSKNVNKSRIAVAKEKLKELKNIKDDPEELKKYFGINTDFCSNNYYVDGILKLIPDVIEKIEVISKRAPNDLLESFSTRVKEVEENLAADVKKTDFGSWNPADKEKLCNKVTEEIIDTIAPKAVLVGHSMGGFINRVITLNPKKVAFDAKGDLTDKDTYTYDAGNGIGLSIGMESPLENGFNFDSHGLREARYDWVDETILRPLEQLTGGFVLFNPFYLVYKAAFKYNCEQYSYNNDIKPAQDPKVHGQVLSVEQMLKDSDFQKKYVIGKRTPEGISSLSYYHPDDKFMDLDSARLDKAYPNNTNITVCYTIKDSDVDKARQNLNVGEALIELMNALMFGNIDITDTDKMSKSLSDPKKMIKSLYAHHILNKKPEEFIEAFEKTILTNPDNAIRMLDLSNSDNLRRQCLDIIYNQVCKAPGFLRNKTKLLAKIVQVSAEKVPFQSSPSYRADQILELIK